MSVLSDKHFPYKSAIGVLPYMMAKGINGPSCRCAEARHLWSCRQTPVVLMPRSMSSVAGTRAACCRRKRSESDRISFSQDLLSCSELMCLFHHLSPIIGLKGILCVSILQYLKAGSHGTLYLPSHIIDIKAVFGISPT